MVHNYILLIYLILGGISDQTLIIRERNITGRSPVSLVVSDNLHFAMLPDTDAGVRGAQINSNCSGFTHFNLIPKFFDIKQLHNT